MLAACVFLWAAPSHAQLPTAADVTDSLRNFERALKIAVGGTTVQESESRTLYLLIDATPSLKQAGFAAKLAQTIRDCANDLTNTRIGVAAVGQSKPILAPTTNHAQVVRAVETMLETPKNEIRNVYASIRRIAASLKGEGQRDIVLVSLENGDAEDAIETTVSHLENSKIRLTAIVRESYLADSYWIKRRRYWHDTRRIRVPKDCELIGGDSPLVDMPWGWLFQQTIVNEVVPSGFGVFGVTRLAAATGGTVFLYSPPAATKHKCAVYGACLFCRGDHLPDGEAYAILKLRELSPLAVSRKDAYRSVATNPYFRAVVTAWRAAAKAGVLQTTPSVQIGGTVARPDRNRGGAYLGFFDSLSFARHARRAEEAAAACSKIITRLEKAMGRSGRSKGRHRALPARGTAEGGGRPDPRLPLPRPHEPGQLRGMVPGTSHRDWSTKKRDEPAPTRDRAARQGAVRDPGHVPQHVPLPRCAAVPRRPPARR